MAERGQRYMNTRIWTILCISLVMTCVTGLSVAEVVDVIEPVEPVEPVETGFCRSHARTLLDFTEGGHLETDFGANLIAEWWYLNGKIKLVASDGEVKDAGFFVVLAHQESPLIAGPGGVQLSHLLTFSTLYLEGEVPTFYYAETYVPQTTISQFVSLHTPYVYYVYPGGAQRYCGSALTGYRLNYKSDAMGADLVFLPGTVKTIDQAEQPLDFITYEHSYGTLSGSMVLNNKTYTVKRGEGYIDHMVPSSSQPWPMDIHGWSWSEVTTEKYQAVAYAIRSLNNSYGNYSYKHLTLLNRHNGRVIAEYSGDQITVIETDWIGEDDFGRKRPATVTYVTSGWNVTVNTESVAYFNQTLPGYAGFVDFMAFEPDSATITRKNRNVIQKGSAFNEYLVSDLGALQSNN
uniref:AttH domain-containing protein n=1 Tax=Candidatus Methanogaster sp. ANME-2c ERB4 TaxID=2759911 RepID=A0A7G9YKP2_9EURY|nr:hypothetical protein CJINKJJD_00009 [Methanosarcinales archaeon ANME-2c ERB4]